MRPLLFFGSLRRQMRRCSILLRSQRWISITPISQLEWPSAAAAVGSRDDLEQMPVRVLEVDPAPAIVMINFARFAARRIGPVRLPALANASEDLVKLAFADEERKVAGVDLVLPFHEIQTDAIRRRHDLERSKRDGRGQPRISARNLAEALLSRAQMIVWLNSTTIRAYRVGVNEFDWDSGLTLRNQVSGSRIADGLEAAEDQPLPSKSVAHLPRQRGYGRSCRWQRYELNAKFGKGDLLWRRCRSVRTAGK